MTPDPRDRDQSGAVSRLEAEDVDLDGVITILDMTMMAQDFGKKVPGPNPAPSPLNSIDRLIATRGSHLLPHEITVPAPMSSWAWGHHATESTRSKQPSSGSVAAWLVVMPDASQIAGVGPVRFNVRRIALWNHETNWRKLHDGLPQWRVSINPDTTSGMIDLIPVVEPDGSYSFPIPNGKALHMAMGPWPTITSGDGIVSVVEGQLLGAADAVLAAKVGLAAGADYRQAGGAFWGFSTPGYYESGFGQFRRLTGEWKAADMLSSVLSDDQVRASGLVL